jgi:hypothetical protein
LLKVISLGLCFEFVGEVALCVALDDGAQLVAALGLEACALQGGDVVSEVDLRFALDAPVFEAAAVNAL